MENKETENNGNGESTEKPVKGWKKYFKKIKKTVDTEYELTEKRYNFIMTKLRHLVRVFTVSGKKFFEDDCPTKSSAIAYTTLISLIPTLTVGLTAFSLWNKASDQKTEIFQLIEKSLTEYNLQKLYNQQMIDVITSLIDNAGKIGVIGFVFLIFSATAILRSLENSLNNIWKIKKQRPIYMKFIIYWATITLGPILLIAGTALTNKVSEAINKPNYYSFNTESSSIVITGSKSNILIARKEDLSGTKNQLKDIFRQVTTDEIDFNNQTIYSYSGNARTFTRIDEPIEKLKFKGNKYTSSEFYGTSGWITAEKGILLKTENLGRSWKIIKLGRLDLLKIKMIDELNGFLASSDGEIFKTADGGFTWEILINWMENKSRLTDMQLLNNSIFVTAENGYLYKSMDLGKTWNIEQLEEAKNKKSYSTLNKIYMSDDKTGYIAGNDGLILSTIDGGRSWQSHNYKNYNFYSLAQWDDNSIYAGGEKGTLVKLNLKTDIFEYQNLKTQNINALTLFSNRLWLMGDSGMILYLDRANPDEWSGTKGTSFIMYILNFMAPFMVIGLGFILIYYALPNIKVPLRAAAMGASVTGSVWVAFTMLFNYYVKILADTTFAIYGALAAIPIFLLTVYASAMIILFGAEITYSLMYPDTYRKNVKSKKTTADIKIINGVRLLFTIFKNFESGKGGTGFTELNKICNDSITEADYFTDIFRRSNFITQMENNTFIPATSSRNVKIREIIDSIHDPNLELYSTASDIVRKKLSEKFKLMNESRAEILGDETLEDLIDAK